MDNDRELEYQVIRSLLKTADNPRNRLEGMLAQALQDELTQRQREAVRLYYIEQMPMRMAADEMGVCISTVSRTIGRAKTRLQRCLKYGGRELLSGDDE